MTNEQLVIWVVVGGISGILADSVVKGTKIGFVGEVIAGILGALLGGWLFSHLHVRIAAGLLGEVIQSFIGALILLAILRSFRK